MKRPNMVKCWNRKNQMKNEPERWDEFATRPIPFPTFTGVGEDVIAV